MFIVCVRFKVFSGQTEVFQAVTRCSILCRHWRWRQQPDRSDTPTKLQNGVMQKIKIWISHLFMENNISCIISLSVDYLTRLRWSDSEISFAVSIELSVMNEFLPFPCTYYKFSPSLSLNPNHVRRLARTVNVSFTSHINHKTCC